jgi:hypothetical protein
MVIDDEILENIDYFFTRDVLILKLVVILIQLLL